MHKQIQAMVLTNLQQSPKQINMVFAVTHGSKDTIYMDITKIFTIL